MLRLHDTATGTVRPLELRRPGAVSLYVCGPTVYDAPHLGHGRFALVFDVLRRYLLFSGLDVTYVSNITDVDDKIIERAGQRGVGEAELAAEYEAVWWEAMDALGVLRPDATPHATEYIDRMVGLIGDLAARGFTYETSDGVYLASGEVPGYGLLAHQPLDSLRAGARVAVEDEKRSPLDFVLWKRAKPGEPTWDSPWGPGRPGWHTECVVMSLDLLGEGFDIHGGAIDLIFPHHENERAQAVALGRDFAHHWVHNGWVMVEGEKMSKSLGNFTSLADLLARSDARAYRILVLRAHYRSPIEVTPETVAQADAQLERLDEMARRFSVHSPLADERFVVGVGVDRGAGDPELAEAVERFTAAMDDDLDTPAALAVVFDLIRAANVAGDSGDEAGGGSRAALAARLAAALGLALAPGDAGAELDARTASLVAARDEARAARDFDRADQIRDELAAEGWVVEDSATGTRVRRR